MPSRFLVTCALTAAIALMLPGAAAAEMDLQPCPLERLAPGEFSPDDLPQGYSHVVMIAWPRLAADQAKQTPGAAAKFAQMFGTAILAGVEQDPATGLRRLTRLGIGHTMRDAEGGLQIVTPRSEGLTFIASQVLASGEQQLDRIQQIARYDTAVLYESPAVMLRGGAHAAMTVRHFVWTSGRQGGLASVLWLVDSAAGAPRLADDFLVQLPKDFTDDRLLSVDPDQFSFIGAPGPTAFAMARLPQGTRLPATPEIRRLAALPRYDQRTLPQLAQALATAVAAGD